MRQVEPQKNTLREIAVRFLSPLHWPALWSIRQSRRVRPERVRMDAQLRLYSELLPDGFLHYGYFDQVDVPGNSVSISDLERAQFRYAERLLDLLKGDSLRVLDVGCGTGGLMKLLAERGHLPEGVTPDQHQVQSIIEKIQLPVHHCRFEDFVGSPNSYDAIITSESFQYLHLPEALPLIHRLLKPGGQWILCDYFRKNPDAMEKSGHVLSKVHPAIEGSGFETISSEDITANVLPTLRVATYYLERFAQPLLKFALAKLSVKAPVLSYLLEPATQKSQQKLDQALNVSSSEKFARDKQYMLMKFQKKPLSQ